MNTTKPFLGVGGLVELAEKLSEKQSWVRKGFKNFLHEWKKATETQLSNSNTKRLCLHKFYVDGRYEKICYLYRGDDKLYEDWNDVAVNAETVCDIDTMDIPHLRKIIENLPERLQKYADKLKEETEECEKILKLLEKFV